MKTLVVSGARSNVGKTTFAKQLCALLPGAFLAKIGHGEPKKGKAARLYQPGTSYGRIAADAADAPYLVIESNSILHEIVPDCAVYLDADTPKPSADLARAKADICRGTLTPDVTVQRLAHRLELTAATVRRIVWLAGARPEPVTGIILAGGLSTRTGTDKALLGVGQESVLARLEQQLAPFCDFVIILASDDNRTLFGSRHVVVDRAKGEGPLGGIAAALDESRTDVNFVVACDIPDIDPHAAALLLSDIDSHDIVVPSFRPGQTKPLMGVYRRSVAAILRARGGPG